MANIYHSRLSSKGQLVIPVEVRERLKPAPGTEFTITEDGGRLIIEERRNAFEAIRKLRGILKGRDKEIQGTLDENREIERRHFEHLQRIGRKR
jgi:AbrB family looped-hinge helix DNA binding protein